MLGTYPWYDTRDRSWTQQPKLAMYCSLMLGRLPDDIQVSTAAIVVKVH